MVTTLIDQISDEDWNDPSVADWNINVGTLTDMPEIAYQTHDRRRYGGKQMSNITPFPTKPIPPDPWERAQQSLTTRHTPEGEREELWSHPYFGISHLIWATGSHATPEPPTPSGGTPVAANAGAYQRLMAVA